MNANFQDRLRGVNTTVGARLDRLGGYLPAAKQPKMPFEEYLARASAQAQGDPEFAQQLQGALAQYQSARGVFDATRQSVR